MTDLIEQYSRIRNETEAACKPLETEDYIPQPEPFVSPPKWHLAHISWFFESMILKQFEKGYQAFNPDYDFLFNSYYESVGKHLLREDRGDLSRPTVKEVYAYRKHVDQAMVKFLNKNPNKRAIELTRLGLQHEQQHQELLRTDIKYILATNPLLPKYSENAPEETVNKGEKSFIKIPEGVYDIGFQGKGFCYDNELNRHKVYLQGYEIQNHLITNKEYIEFIKDDGYKKPRLWHADGWNWVKENKASMPLYWTKKDNQYLNFTYGGLRPIIPEVQLAHINYYEAYAFARWKGLRLPTEFEWEAAANQLDYGTRWEWTESAYLPYPGYQQAESPDGEYNGKFMVSQKVLRGSSIATSKGHTRPSYRNFFYPPERWQFTGIRLAK